MPGPFTLVEREAVYACLVADEAVSWAEIGRRLDRSPTTVAREVARNGGRSGYRPSQAQCRADAQRRRPRPFKLETDLELRRLVIAGLLAELSPASLSHDLEAIGLKVAPDTIYGALYSGRLGLNPADCLRTRRPRRRPRKRKHWEKGHYLGEYTSISQRPDRANNRTETGHWEGDLIIGAYNQSAMITLIERVCRYTVLLPLPHGYGTRAVIPVLNQWLAGLPHQMRRSLTWDQGAEMTHWPKLQALTDGIYFCDARSPWQRGCNEQNNRTLRFWLPRTTNLAITDPTPIMAVINHQRRRSLNWQTPHHVYHNHLTEP